MKFEAVGVGYYIENLQSAGKKSWLYGKPDDEFLSNAGDGRDIYEYYFKDTAFFLTPEPDNPNDKNAIAIKANGFTVGYVSKDDLPTVRKLLNEGYAPKIYASGGNVKCVRNGEIKYISRKYKVVYEFEDNASSRAKESIRYDNMRRCPRCGSQMNYQLISEEKKTGCGTILLYLILALTIFGLLIVIPLVLSKKTETVGYSVCPSCGYKFRHPTK